MNKNPIRVLNCTNDLANGGIEAFCLNVNKNIQSKKFIFDYFLTLGFDEYYKENVHSKKGKVFNIRNMEVPNHISESMKIFYIAKKILKENGPYSAVHIHNCKGMSSILLAARICKVPVRITHSHSSSYSKVESNILKIKIKISSIIDNIFINLLATNKLGCSEYACKSMYGQDCLKDKRTEVIFNGIDLDKFNSSKYDKSQLIGKYEVNKSNINFINIGRYTEEKNQLFLIDTFYELNKIRDDIYLTIIGYGELENKIKDHIAKLNLQDKVKLMPHDSCIPEVLSTMDYFILPSLCEGLGIVLIEAQAMGLSCFASNYVPKEANIGLCNYIKLEDGAEKWAEEINDYVENSKNQQIDLDKLIKYDIKNVVKRLEEIYCEKTY